MSQGFWSHTLERFLYLYDFVAQYEIRNLVHLENDTMLYVDIAELLPYFEENHISIGAPFESLVACIPCFVFIKDKEAFRPLIKHINAQLLSYRGNHADMEVGDMHTLASFSAQFGEEKLLPLPVLMPEYAACYEKRVSSYAPDNSTPLSLLSKHAHLFPGYLFDAATLGVFANGNDRFHQPHSKPGTIHHRSLFDPSPFTFFWGKDLAMKEVPYLTFQGTTYRIINLHLHSKLLDSFTSYLEHRANFP
jgi:hypothetical protein